MTSLNHDLNNINLEERSILKIVVIGLI